MDNKVMLTIRGRQWYDDGSPDTTNLTTQGRMTRRPDGSVLLSYEETEITGLEGTHTQLLITPERVTLERSGSVASHMVFQVGRNHCTLYQTPWGAVSMDISTEKLSQNFHSHGGLVEIRYRMSLANQVVSQNRLSIHIRNIMR